MSNKVNGSTTGPITTTNPTDQIKAEESSPQTVMDDRGHLVAGASGGEPRVKRGERLVAKPIDDRDTALHVDDDAGQKVQEFNELFTPGSETDLLKDSFSVGDKTKEDLATSSTPSESVDDPFEPLDFASSDSNKDWASSLFGEDILLTPDQRKIKKAKDTMESLWAEFDAKEAELVKRYSNPKSMQDDIVDSMNQLTPVRKKKFKEKVSNALHKFFRAIKWPFKPTIALKVSIVNWYNKRVDEKSSSGVSELEASNQSVAEIEGKLKRVYEFLGIAGDDFSLLDRPSQDKPKKSQWGVDKLSKYDPSNTLPASMVLGSDWVDLKSDAEKLGELEESDSDEDEMPASEQPSVQTSSVETSIENPSQERVDKITAVHEDLRERLNVLAGNDSPSTDPMVNALLVHVGAAEYEDKGKLGTIIYKDSADPDVVKSKIDTRVEGHGANLETVASELLESEQIPKQAFQEWWNEYKSLSDIWFDVDE